MDIVITTFGAVPDSEQDTVPAVLAALDRCRQHSGCRLVFPKGTYHFYRHRAPERLLYVSNNDGGVTRMGIPLLSMQDLELDGEGSRFIFHGRMIPVAVWDSRNIRLRRFSIDWDRPFTLEAQVLDQQPTYVDLQMSPATPYVIREGRLSGLDDDCYTQRKIAVTEFDLLRQEFAFDSAYPHWTNVAEQLEPGRVRLKVKGDEVFMGKGVTTIDGIDLGPVAEVVHSPDGGFEALIAVPGAEGSPLAVPLGAVREVSAHIILEPSAEEVRAMQDGARRSPAVARALHRARL